jgi:hypothetical protein
VAKGVAKANEDADLARTRLLKQLDLDLGDTKSEPPKDMREARMLFKDYKGGKMTPQQARTLWNYAKDSYLDKGETDFDTIRHGLATDFGLKVNDVTRGLTQSKALRAISDDMYAKMAAQRRLVQNAKAWLKNTEMPAWLRTMRAIPRAFFVAKILGHGTVGMITHAGLNMFNPAAWRTYWPAFFQQYKLLGWHDKGAYHERMMQDLVRDPLYVKARRSGLANDPFKYTDDYNSAFAQFFKKHGIIGNRGFDSLKLFRQARFNQMWNDLPATLKTDNMAKMIADAVNHATGTVKMPFREWANWTFFAPKLEGSRWAWMVGDPLKAGKTFANWPKETPEARQFAMQQLKEKAYIAGTYYTLLAINQGLLSATGSDQKVNFLDPRKSDFMSFKAGGHNLGIVGPMLGMVRLFADLLNASVGDRTKFENVQGTRAEEFATKGFKYARGKFSPLGQTVVDTAAQADFEGRPMPFSNDVPNKGTLRHLYQEGHKTGTGKYTYGQYAPKVLLPIPVEDAVKEVWRSQGMKESEMNTYMNALLTAVITGGTGARYGPDYNTTPKKP